MSGLPIDCTTKKMMEALEIRYHVSSNAEIDTLMQTFFNMRYDGSSGARDYVFRMVDLQTNTLPPNFWNY